MLIRNVLCVERTESAVDADVQGRSERVSQVRHFRAAQRAPPGHVRRSTSDHVHVVWWRPWRWTSCARQTGAQPYRSPLQRLLGSVLQMVSTLQSIACAYVYSAGAPPPNYSNWPSVFMATFLVVTPPKQRLPFSRRCSWSLSVWALNVTLSNLTLPLRQRIQPFTTNKSLRD